MVEASEDRPFLSWLTRRWTAPRRASEQAPPIPAAGGGVQPDSRPPEPPGAGASAPAPRRDELERVQAVTASLLTRKMTPRELFRHMVDGAADCLHADEASLMLVEGAELRVVSARQAQDHVTIMLKPTRLGEGVAGWVAREGTPVLLNEGDDLSRFVNLAFKGGRIRSAISVPLQVEGRVVGVLNANRLAGRANFTSDDLVVMRLFADTAALAIDQMNLLQTVQTRARSLQALLSVTETFAGDTEPETALTRLVPGLGDAFHLSHALAFLGTADSEVLDVVAGWDPRSGPVGPAALAGVKLALADDVAEAFRRREPAWVKSQVVGGTPQLQDLLPARLLLVPVAGGEAVSRCALVLVWDDPIFTLPPEDLRVLEGVARQLELVLSRQDRAATVGALEAEMALARAHLMEAERLATVGQSMAGVVHDINAPLTAVQAFAQLLQKDSEEPKTRERAGHILEAAQRAQRLVRELLTMARPHPPAFEVVDLQQLLRVSMDLERPQCAVSGIKLVAAFTREPLPVKADPHRIGQVFTNLLVNARQAIDAAGKGTVITVGTQRVGPTAEVRISDDGPGIPPAIKPKIFDWFFTTKPPGEGTGLGLAVSREIMLAQGGGMRLEDAPGGGAVFVIDLPLAEGA